MAEIVHDANGAAFELRSGGASISGLHRSIRDALDHTRSVSSLLAEPGNRDALAQALVRLGACRADEAVSLPFEEVAARARDALSSGALVLVPVTSNRRLMASTFEPPPERLTDLAGPEPEVKATHTLELHLVDASGEPVPGEAFRVELPGGEIREGRLDASGKALVTGIPEAGTCRVNFPRWDQDCWKPA